MTSVTSACTSDGQGANQAIHKQQSLQILTFEATLSSQASILLRPNDMPLTMTDIFQLLMTGISAESGTEAESPLAEATL